MAFPNQPTYLKRPPLPFPRPTTCSRVRHLAVLPFQTCSPVTGVLSETVIPTAGPPRHILVNLRHSSLSSLSHRPGKLNGINPFQASLQHLWREMEGGRWREVRHNGGEEFRESIQQIHSERPHLDPPHSHLSSSRQTITMICLLPLLSHFCMKNQQLWTAIHG